MTGHTSTVQTPVLRAAADRVEPTVGPWDARRIVLGCFIGLAVSCPAVYSHCYGIYLNAIVRETGWSRAEVSLGFTIPSLLAAVLAFPVGAWIDRAGSRGVILTGTVLFPATLAAFASIPADFVLFLLAALAMGVSLALLAPPTYLTLPPQWFDRNLGIATAVAALGGSIGSALMPLLTQALVTAHGWRAAFWNVAGIVAVIGIGNALLLIRDHPRQRRQAHSAPPVADGSSVGEAVRDRRFWLLAFTFFLIVLVGAGYAIHAVAILADRGFAPAPAALALVCFSIAALAGQVLAGAMIDRFRFWTTGAVFIVGQATGGLLMLSQWGGATPFIAAGLIGATIGAAVAIMPVTLRHLFGLRAFGRIFGLAFAIFSIGSALGPLAMGFSFDRLGSYAPAMTGLLIADAAALALFVGAVGRTRASDFATPTENAVL